MLLIPDTRNEAIKGSSYHRDKQKKEGSTGKQLWSNQLPDMPPSNKHQREKRAPSEPIQGESKVPSDERSASRSREKLEDQVHNADENWRGYGGDSLLSVHGSSREALGYTVLHGAAPP